MENLMQVIILLSHDISSNPVLLLVDDDPKKLQQVFFIKWYIQDGDIYRVIPYKWVVTYRQNSISHCCFSHYFFYL